ncbi:MULTISPECIES: hypothetical protein [unclassified Pseudodesulfovibrio]|uniref:hypothetical protein n=1 Tax=unclassified Pseudodesulfovibrio TaxID=2661612 RepID=UPI000FEB75F2|nr:MULTISPECIES: hypothetical protein [unclassified Pseudodesulfovibrio]MCJ2164036.1 hypothetical protein [Pseudodesulfovibrio sp. S3-i]RWU05328.1 hypothetical protein DWB63_06670 [Pseudodesulfovibrio sp. S3]
MRIRGSGTGSGDSQNGSGSGRRSDSFRRKYRLGQKIRGILLKNLPNSMAWVEIDDIRLLAQIEARHQEGSHLLFIVNQLTPDIILKELPLSQTTGVNVLGLASAFDTARTLFEHRFRTGLQESGYAGNSLDIAGFLKLLAQHPDIHAAYMDAFNCVSTISASLEADRKGHVLYQPWLAPESLRQTTFIRDSGDTTKLSETIVEFDHAALGLVRVQFLYKGNTLAYKLKIQHPDHEKSLQKYLNSREHRGLTLGIQHLGTSKLPRNSHCGIITEMLFKT